MKIAWGCWNCGWAGEPGRERMCPVCGARLLKRDRLLAIAQSRQQWAEDHGTASRENPAKSALKIYAVIARIDELEASNG